MLFRSKEFMNRVVSKIAEIDGGEITVYSGNYDFYLRERAIREANQEAAYARQQAMLAKEQRFIERFAAHAAKAAQVQSRVKALDKIEKIELPKKRRVVKFDFRVPPRSGEQVATLEGITKAYGRRVVHDGVNLTIRRGERWSVMGRNGAGKSTLLKMIAGAVAPDAGEVKIGASVKMGYFAQQALDVLNPDLTIEEQLGNDFPAESIGARAAVELGTSTGCSGLWLLLALEQSRAQKKRLPPLARLPTKTLLPPMPHRPLLIPLIVYSI